MWTQLLCILALSIKCSLVVAGSTISYLEQIEENNEIIYLTFHGQYLTTTSSSGGVILKKTASNIQSFQVFNANTTTNTTTFYFNSTNGLKYLCKESSNEYMSYQSSYTSRCILKVEQIGGYIYFKGSNQNYLSEIYTGGYWLWAAKAATDGYCKSAISTTLPTKDPTNSPTMDPTTVPTSEPTVEPTINPSVEPTTEPTIPPSVTPSVNPTTIPTKSPTKENCELIRLNLTMKTINVTKFIIVFNEQSKFEEVVNDNIGEYYQQRNDDTLSVTFHDLQIINNNSLALSYNIMNCNPNIQGLTDYLGSSLLNSSLTKTLNDIYQNITNKKKYVTITRSHARTIWSYLPPPFVLDKFDINNPVAIVVISIVVFVLIVIIIGYFQSKWYNLYSVIGCKLTDNFNPSRVIFFLLTVFILFNNLNTSYAYFYEYSVYHDTAIVVLAAISLILIIINIIYDGLLVKSFENDIEIATDNKYVDSWLKRHQYKLICLIILSSSFYNSLSLVNSNLFGLDLFRMRLSNKQLFKFKTYKIQHILISSSQLFVHTYFIFYIVIKGHQILNNNDQVAYLSIFSIIGCLFNVLSQIITRCSSTNFQYETTNIDIRIDVDNDNDNDRVKLQKQKDLTKNIKGLLAKMLEIYPTDIEVMNTKQSLNGIIISCIKYDKIIQSTNSNNKTYELASIELQKSLLNDVGVDDDGRYTNSRIRIESQLSSDNTKHLIQELYGLNNAPSNVSYDINIRSFNNTFTKSIST